MSTTRFVRSQELKKPAHLLKEMTEKGETCFVTEDGKAKGVLMDIHRYHALMDLVEEAESVKHHTEVGHETRKLISVKKLITTKKRPTRMLRKKD